jgi:hypothetical protein
MMVKKPYRIILLISAFLALGVYLLDAFMFDTVTSKPSAQNSLLHFIQSFILYFLLFAFIFSGIYWSINKIKSIVKKLP